MTSTYRKKGNWLVQHDAMIRERTAAGESARAIATRLGVSESAIAKYRHRHGIVAPVRTADGRSRQRQLGGARPRQPKGECAERRCLRCRDLFNSEGIHNRICPSCTVYNSRQSDIAVSRAPAAPARALR